MHTVYGLWLVAALAGESIAIDQTIQQGATLGNLSQAAVWALVALVSVCGLIKLYWDTRNDQEDLKSIIKESSTAIAKNTEVLDKLSDKIDKCPNQ